MGGNVVLNFAFAHPERVSALILADTGAGSDDTARMVARSLQGADLLERDGIEAYVDWAMSHPAFGHFASRGPEEERFIRSCLMTNRGLALSTRGVQVKRPPIYALEPQLRQSQMPVLLIVGEHDEACGPVHAFMGRTIPRAAHHVISGAGHLTNLEAPEAFNRLVADFLETPREGFVNSARKHALDPSDAAYPGQEVYSRGFLRIYDPVILGFYGNVVWRCPTSRLVEQYRRYVGHRHLDVGPGTGYFLEHARLPKDAQITLLDPNQDVQSHAARRLAGRHPAVIRADVLKPLPLTAGERFDSAALN